MTGKRIFTLCIIIVLLPMLYGSAIRLPELTDIQGHWAADFIVECTKRGICVGYDNESFEPNEPVTRAEFTKMVVNAFQLSDLKRSLDSELKTADLKYMEFEDVNRHWSKPYVETAYLAGIIKGVDESRFMPDNPLSRQDAILILSRVEN